jgi:hypothetical protein
MSVRQDPPHVSHVLWSLNTRSSSITCEVSTLPNGACELRVYQSGELAVREVFQSLENAERYSAALRDRLRPLAVVDPEINKRAS